MKAKHDKSVWQPEVQILLDLKKKLADLKSREGKPSESPSSKSKKPETVFVPEQNGDVSKDAATLESTIITQVRSNY